jgi:hypothetical protein
MSESPFPGGELEIISLAGEISTYIVPGDAFAAMHGEPPAKLSEMAVYLIVVGTRHYFAHKS